MLAVHPFPKADSILAREMLDARRWFESTGTSIREFEVKALGRYLTKVALLWFLALGVLYIGNSLGILGIFLTIAILGYIQRALGNLFHDFSHGGFKSMKVADLLGNILIGMPCLVTMSCYRRNHLAHHVHLGNADLDPDFIHDEEVLRHGAAKAYWRYIFTWRIWLGSTLGQIPFTPTIWPTLQIAAWWTTLFLLFSVRMSLDVMVHAVGLWFLARATTFHLITTFREMADHVGLSPGGLRSFTRSNPASGPWKYLFHPFENGLHLAHHLFPKVPYYHIREVHERMMSYSYYAHGEICGTYFSPSTPPTSILTVARSLTKCVRNES